MERPIGDLIGRRVRVRAGDHGDRVLAASVDMDQRDAGRGVHGPHVLDVDIIGAQQRERRFSESIAADRTVKCDVRAGATRGECLIRALAAGMNRERTTEERFARLWKPIDGRDEIDVDRSENHDHRIDPSLLRKRTAA